MLGSRIYPPRFMMIVPIIVILMEDVTVVFSGLRYRIVQASLAVIMVCSVASVGSVPSISNAVRDSVEIVRLLEKRVVELMSRTSTVYWFYFRLDYIMAIHGIVKVLFINYMI